MLGADRRPQLGHRAGCVAERLQARAPPGAGGWSGGPPRPRGRIGRRCDASTQRGAIWFTCRHDGPIDVRPYMAANRPGSTKGTASRAVAAVSHLQDWRHLAGVRLPPRLSSCCAATFRRPRKIQTGIRAGESHLEFTGIQAPSEDRISGHMAEFAPPRRLGPAAKSAVEFQMRLPWGYERAGLLPEHADVIGRLKLGHDRGQNGLADHIDNDRGGCNRNFRENDDEAT